jgi:hypothetical protein
LSANRTAAIGFWGEKGRQSIWEEGWSVIGEIVTKGLCDSVGEGGTRMGEQYLIDQGIMQNKTVGGGSVRPAVLQGKKTTF